MLTKYAEKINKDEVCQRQAVTFTTIKRGKNPQTIFWPGLSNRQIINIKGENRRVA